MGGGLIGRVRALEEFWLHRTRRAPRPPCTDRWMADRILLDALGLGIEQTAAMLGRSRCGREEFEHWIEATAGPPDEERIARYHAWLDGAPPPAATAARLAAIEAATPVLDGDDLDAWQRDGCVILRAAVSADEAAAAARALWTHLGADSDDQATWYAPNPRVHKAFAQLWGTADLWMTTDRMSFNAPERPDRPFPGPHLHWDVSLTTPIPFATQAILYLTDTAEDQGALTLVPGFHRRSEAWLAGLPDGADPRQQDLSADARPVAAGAGDLIIWRHDLPHGASPNRGARPRLAQYVNMYSPTETAQRAWR